MSDVTIVVINYNGERYIKDCLTSVFEAEICGSMVVLIDNKSNDQSVEIVKKGFPQVKIIELDKNYGPGKARNIGILESQTKWVLLLDVDTIVTKDWLKLLLEEVSNCSDIGIGASRVLFYDNKEMINSEGGGYVHYVGTMVLKNGFCPISKTNAEISKIGAAGAVSIIVNKEKAIEAGLFDEDFFIYLEDCDFSLRMRIRGYKILSVPTSVIYHRGGTAGISYRGNGSYPNRNAYLHIRNRLMLILKVYSKRSIFIFLPAFLWYELALFGITLKKGLIKMYVEAWLDVINHLREILHKRRDIQTTRKVSDGQILWAGTMIFPPGLAADWIERIGKIILDYLLYGYWKIIRRFV